MDFQDPQQSGPEAALQHYQQGMELKKNGQNDLALTAFRRAALAHPNHFETQMEIGLLCRQRGKADPLFFRYAFDAFRMATKLNPAHEDAHNQYILMGHKLGRLDELVTEYEKLAQADPMNEMYPKCKMNILHMSMAMMSPVSTKKKGSGKMSRLILIGSLGLGLLGLGLIISPAIIIKVRPDLMNPGMAPTLVKVGIFFMVLFAVGLFIRRKV